jgi:hypothetical protein
MQFFPEYFDGTLREHYLVLFGSAGAIAMVIGGFSAWLGARWGARRAARRAIEEARLHGASARVESQLEQLTESIDLIALEVERIAEAQRFAARLLAERPATTPAPVRRDPGVITPH